MARTRTTLQPALVSKNTHIGKSTQKVIQAKVVIVTPIISRIYAYPWKRKDKEVLALHVVTDDGKLNTVISKILKKVDMEVQHAYDVEVRAKTGESALPVMWRHSQSNRHVPDDAQLIYARPEVE